MQTNKIDVLAVMDGMTRFGLPNEAGPEGTKRWKEYREARAAVAEVIDLLREAAETAERDASKLYGVKRDQLLAQARRYRASLVRVGGAA